MSLRILGLTAADRDRLLAVHGAAFFFDPDTISADVRHGVPGLGADVRREPRTAVRRSPASTRRTTWPSRSPGRSGAWAGADAGAVLGLGPPRPPPPRGAARDGTHHLADLRDQGVALSGLHAAEVAIYGRFGYAAASAEVELTLARGTAFAAPALQEAAAAVRTHYVEADSDETATAVQELHLRCATTLGAVTRPDPMTRSVLVDQPRSRQGRETGKVLFASVDGQPTGYARFPARAAGGGRPAGGHGDGAGAMAAADPGLAARAGPAAGRLRPDHDDPDRRTG